jgi:hypothetical protein
MRLSRSTDVLGDSDPAETKSPENDESPLLLQGITLWDIAQVILENGMQDQS